MWKRGACLHSVLYKILTPMVEILFLFIVIVTNIHLQEISQHPNYIYVQKQTGALVFVTTYFMLKKKINKKFKILNGMMHYIVFSTRKLTKYEKQKIFMAWKSYTKLKMGDFETLFE